MTTSSLRWTTPAPVLPASKTVPLLRQAVAAAPDRADLKVRLATALLRAGANLEVIDLFGPADAGHPAPELLALVGRAALAVGDDRLAADTLSAAAADGLTAVHGYLAEALYRLNRRDEALDAAQQRLRDQPADFEALQVIARVLFQRGEVERLWRLTVDLRNRGAWGAWFSAAAASAAAALKNETEFKAMFDRPRWFSNEKLSVPTDFNRDLAAELLALRPSATTMRIDFLERVGGSVSKDLFIMLRRAVESYIAQREDLLDDPVMAHRPSDAILTGWAILTEESRHHGWHIHQAGWISGVYYIQVPKIEFNRVGLAGAIEFGPYPFSDDDSPLQPYRWHVRPEPGSLLLFPSYFAHRTWPTGLKEPRICVAFDIRPVRRPAASH